MNRAIYFKFSRNQLLIDPRCFLRLFKEKGRSLLEKEISKLCLSLLKLSKPEEGHFKFITSKETLITRERHRQSLEACVQNLKNFEEKNSQEDFDKAAEDLRLATRHLGMIVGKVDVEEILGSIFSDFCIGK